MKAGLIIKIIYYVIALIIFILFRRKKIIVTFNGKEVTKQINKYIVVIQIACSVAWPVTFILTLINSIKGRE